MIETNNDHARDMRRIGSELLAHYMSDDWVARALRDNARAGDQDLTCHRWIADTPAKRLAFALLYGDLARDGGKRVLDIGGGLSSLTRLLCERNDYELIDLMAHDTPDQVERFQAASPNFKLTRSDWHDAATSGTYDVVIASDLFPNVDQRLELFLDRMLPLAREVRFSLTLYNKPRFYITRRVDADEILCMLAWNGHQAKDVIGRFIDRVINPNIGLFLLDKDLVYPNGRQVFLLTLRGDAESA